MSVPGNGSFVGSTVGHQDPLRDYLEGSGIPPSWWETHPIGLCGFYMHLAEHTPKKPGMYQGFDVVPFSVATIKGLSMWHDWVDSLPAKIGIKLLNIPMIAILGVAAIVEGVVSAVFTFLVSIITMCQMGVSSHLMWTHFSAKMLMRTFTALIHGLFSPCTIFNTISYSKVNYTVNFTP